MSLIDKCLHALSKPRIQLTLLYSSFYLWIGTVIAAPGPALIALSRQTGAPLDSIGFILTGRALAYLVGSFGGLLFDRFDAHRLIFVSLCSCAIGSLCIPISNSIGTLGASVAAQGLVLGFMDTGVNALIFVLHEGTQVEPYMQTLHFSFGMGAFIAPFVVGTVLKAYDGSARLAFLILGLIGVPLILLLWRFPTPNKDAEARALYRDGDLDQPNASAQADADRIEVETNERSKEGTKVTETSWDNPAPELLVEPTRVDIEPSASAQDEASKLPTPFCKRPRRELISILLLAGMLFFAVGLEVCTAAYVSTFAVKALSFDEVTGASLTASFWGMFTLSRFCAIFFSLYLTSAKMIAIGLVGVTIGVNMLLMFATTHASIVWFAVPLLGFSIGPLFPTTMTFADKYLDVTTTVATALVIGSSAGEMSIPAIAAPLVPHVPISLWWIEFGALIGAIACSSTLYFCFTMRVKPGELERDHANIKKEEILGTEKHVSALDSAAVYGASQSSPSTSPVSAPPFPSASSAKQVPQSIGFASTEMAPPRAKSIQQPSRNQPPARARPSSAISAHTPVQSQIRSSTPVSSSNVTTMPQYFEEDPNIDWVEYERLYGPRFPEKS